MKELVPKIKDVMEQYPAMFVQTLGQNIASSNQVVRKNGEAIF